MRWKVMGLQIWLLFYPEHILRKHWHPARNSLWPRYGNLESRVQTHVDVPQHFIRHLHHHVPYDSYTEAARSQFQTNLIWSDPTCWVLYIASHRKKALRKLMSASIEISASSLQAPDRNSSSNHSKNTWKSLTLWSILVSCSSRGLRAANSVTSSPKLSPLLNGIPFARGSFVVGKFWSNRLDLSKNTTIKSTQRSKREIFDGF